VASEGTGVDFCQAASAATEVLRMHRRTLRMTGHPRPLDPVDEIVVAVGSRYHLLRTLTAFPEHSVISPLRAFVCWRPSKPLDEGDAVL
jgi:hypothetical protein